MKSIIAIVLLAATLPLLQGCAASCASFNKNLQVQTGAGLERRVTFYSIDGTPIQTWEGKFITEEEEGSPVLHILDTTTNKRISIAGSYIIEEK